MGLLARSVAEVWNLMGMMNFGIKKMDDNSSILLYTTADGETRLEVKLVNENVWLSLEQMAQLFQRNKSTISRHIRNVFEEGELEPSLVVAKFATTTKHGAMEDRTQTHNVEYFNLDMIISVGYRVKSHRGVQFRIWATNVLREYLKKGFVLNDDLLKNGGGNYFDELLARIRDIRSSEQVFYRKVLQIYALSIDYDPRAEQTRRFFQTVQNKMHFSAHGHTAAEIIFNRADAEKDFMGLTTWRSGSLPRRSDAEIAKNYLTADEVDTLNRIVNLYLDFAELQAKSHTPMYMSDWILKLDDFLRISGRELLTHAGTISAEIAKKKANMEYDKFHERTQETLTPVELHFLENLEREQKKLKDKKG